MIKVWFTTSFPRLNDYTMYDVNAGTREIKISVSFEILMKTRGYVPSDVEKMIRELLEFGAEKEVENVIKTLGIIQKRLPP